MKDLRSLVVHSCLKVHNIIVEPGRVRATYTLIRKDGSEASNELIYSYKHPLFDPELAKDINLASMMLAQVALNYGLFFDRIEFDGLFDDTDRRFLVDMMENTSREILVNKFYSPNEFLVPPFDKLTAEHPKKFTAATLEFINGKYAGMKLQNVKDATNKHAYAILSSGGKDSLLTYGLVSELGEAFPVFINESGRHWYTAVNAHKYLTEIEPNTSKPWCNSDRIFSWMARQMPFIRENFQNIRADNYPIRLWTVAVFLFGVLPIVRKRGIGNILIGNEYDTTLKGNFRGITHYLGLYDQSRYFDNALTRYYVKKGWDVRQYSALRCLSELLILKILVKRYPDLQAQQVSCHAAHEKDGRMYPCGKCEKCRRIVGMLTALGEDPGRCGYSPEQIANGLEALSLHSIKQLSSDAAHLYALLLRQGAIARNEYTEKKAREHPEIESLRFDRERSSLEDLPDHLREPLLSILTEYSQGAVHLVNRKWHTFALEASLQNSPSNEYTEHGKEK
jgi:hypothetical protein